MEEIFLAILGGDESEPAIRNNLLYCAFWHAAFPPVERCWSWPYCNRRRGRGPKGGGTAGRPALAGERRYRHRLYRMQGWRVRSGAAGAAIIAICLYSGYTIERVLAANAATPVAFNLGTAHRNLPYCNGQALDLYIPRSPRSQPPPIAMYVHGGGMTAGDKANLNPVFLNALASAGYAVASVNYRLAPATKFPGQIEDVKCAIRFLHDKASSYGVDGRRILAFGTSVGGQLVALAALTAPSSLIAAAEDRKSV